METMNPTRRAFFQWMAAAPCAFLPSSRITYQGRADCIEVMRGQRKIQVVSSAQPAGFALDAIRQRLFVVNDIDEYEGRPTGSIESYAIEPGTGRIELRDRRPLSLSATGPRHLAVSPDGQHLVVAVYGGGAYNVLPVRADGTMGGVTQVVKEIGSGPHAAMQATAHPHSVAFHSAGQLVVATDLGADRISLFSFEDGRLQRLQQIATPPGSGPGGFEISRHGDSVLVQHKLQPFLCRYRFSERS